MPSSQV